MGLGDKGEVWTGGVQPGSFQKHHLVETSGASGAGGAGLCTLSPDSPRWGLPQTIQFPGPTALTPGLALPTLSSISDRR